MLKYNKILLYTGLLFLTCFTFISFEGCKNKHIHEPASQTPSQPAKSPAGNPPEETKEEIITKIKQSPGLLFTQYSTYQNDKDVVIAAVSHDGHLLKDLPTGNSLRNDPEVVMAAVKQYGKALEFVNPTLRQDASIVKAAVANDGYALAFADPTLKNDINIVITAVRGCDQALQFASLELKKIRELIFHKIIKFIR